MTLLGTGHAEEVGGDAAERGPQRAAIETREIGEGERERLGRRAVVLYVEGRASSDRERSQTPTADGPRPMAAKKTRKLSKKSGKKGILRRVTFWVTCTVARVV